MFKELVTYWSKALKLKLSAILMIFVLFVPANPSFQYAFKYFDLISTNISVTIGSEEEEEVGGVDEFVHSTALVHDQWSKYLIISINPFLCDWHHHYGEVPTPPPEV